MKKFILVIVMTIESSKLCLAGVFTVTQYNLSIRPYSVTETKSYIAKESAWDGEPQTGTYTKVSFADLETNTDGNGNSCTPNFATVSFPGNIGGKHDWFAVEVKGFIKIPRPGWWSFACGSDDGFETTISGHGKSFTFAYDGHRWYATDVKPFYFEEAGVYKVQIVFFDYHINATLDFSMAEGYYTSFRSSIFHLAEAVDGVCTVSYNANCGTGTMAAQTFEEGKEQKLSKNTYRKDGYVFQGWATTLERATMGTVDYTDEQEIMIDSDMTLYAVWASPSLTLAAESADWSSGSITLRCTDADTSGRTHTYTLQYYDESTGTWKDVSSVQTASTAASLTDTSFSSRLGGIPPVKYRVKDENGRASAECVTRNRHGIFVGVGKFVEDANNMNNLAIDNGGFSGTIRLRTSPGAKYSDVKKAFEDVADRTKDKPGDVCVIYFSTHGGRYNNTTIGHLVLDDRPPESEDPRKQGYHEGLLA